MLYTAIENSGGFYHSPVARSNRSNMNVPFTIPSSQDLEKEFIAEATKLGLVSHLRCHDICRCWHRPVEIRGIGDLPGSLHV